MAMLRRFLQDESAATAVEYGLIVAVLSLTIVAAVTNAGSIIRDNFEYLGGLIADSTAAD